MRAAGLTENDIDGRHERCRSCSSVIEVSFDFSVESGHGALRMGWVSQPVNGTVHGVRDAKLV